MSPELKKQNRKFGRLSSFCKIQINFGVLAVKFPKEFFSWVLRGPERRSSRARLPERQMFRFFTHQDLNLWKCSSVSALPAFATCLSLVKKTRRASSS